MGHAVRPLPAALAVPACALGLLGCASSGASSYEAQIRRTTYGVPHVLASDFGSLGFGQGYAVAEDHVCTIADQVVRVRSERAKYFGPGENDANVDDDFALLALGIRETARAAVASQPPETREMLRGFVAGYDKYLADTPSARRPAECRGAAWVTPIDEVDVLSRAIDLSLVGFERVTERGLARAQPPGTGATAEIELPPARHALEAASNGWALGKERTESGHGMLLANPHFPWEGELRFHEIHLTIPSRLDVYGAGLLGMPGVAIGFNPDVAWTATASASSRSVLYRLQLVPGEPTAYVLDGQRRAMERREAAIDVLRGGRVVRETRALYRSEQGPIVALPGLGWTADAAFALRSAGADNASLVATWVDMMSARGLPDLESALGERGIPWANTIATDRAGDTLYVDSSRVPGLSQGTLEAWEHQLAAYPIVARMWGHKIVLLDGSTTRSDWAKEGSGAYPFLVPFDRAPRLARADFVFNANDSFWMSNPAAPIRGVSPLYGEVDKALSPRTRMNARLLMDRSTGGPAGSDGRFSLAELEGAVSGEEGIVTDLLKEPFVARCSAVRDATPRFAAACRTIAGWNGRDTLDGKGAALWREVLGVLDEHGGPFADPFDARSPVDAPRVLVAAPPNGPDPVVAALTAAIGRLDDAAVPIDAPLGSVQYLTRPGSKIPMPGCSDLEGCLNAVGYTSQLTTSLLRASHRGGRVNDATGLGRDGYALNYGSSFVLTVELGDGAPRADAVLVYGESGDASSSHRDDQAAIWAQGHLRPVLFTDAAIEKATESRRTLTATRRPPPLTP